MDLFYDATLADFPRLSGETDDAPRMQRAIDSCAGGVLFLPRGEYEIAKTVLIHNYCSLWMHKSARIVAKAPMDFMLDYDGCLDPAVEIDICNTPDKDYEDYNLFIRGGDLDGGGLASCLALSGFHHFTLSDITLRNGKRYGLRVGERGETYELIANNVYCRCNMSGLAGNAGISINGGDSHYTDCVVVDYTRGIEVLAGGSNRLTRCHVWGGPIPPAHPGELAEMLVDSVCFDLKTDETILRDCYADTGAIGFHVCGSARLLGCSYYSNPYFQLDNARIIVHEKGELYVANCRFAKTMEHIQCYEGHGPVFWRDNQYCGGIEHPWEA